MRKRKNEPVEESQYEELISQSELGCMRDWNNGMMSVALGGEAGMLWAVRLPDGSLATMFIWERHERWYVNLVVYAAANKVIFESRQELGPYPTRGHASKWAGKLAGDMVKKHLVQDIEEQDPPED